MSGFCVGGCGGRWGSLFYFFFLFGDDGIGDGDVYLGDFMFGDVCDVVLELFLCGLYMFEDWGVGMDGGCVV